MFCYICMYIYMYMYVCILILHICTYVHMYIRTMYVVILVQDMKLALLAASLDGEARMLPQKATIAFHWRLFWLQSKKKKNWCPSSYEYGTLRRIMALSLLTGSTYSTYTRSPWLRSTLEWHVPVRFFIQLYCIHARYPFRMPPKLPCTWIIEIDARASAWFLHVLLCKYSVGTCVAASSFVPWVEQLERSHVQYCDARAPRWNAPTKHYLHTM